MRDQTEFKVVRQQLARLMRNAENGELRYGRKLDVVEVRREPAVLELRLNVTVQFPNEKRKIRLYFSEPDAVEGILLAAKVAAKPAADRGLSLQDEHMDEAFEVMKQYLDQRPAIKNLH